MVMFALAGMGLFAIFNAIQGATESSRGTTTASTALQAMLDGAKDVEGARPEEGVEGKSDMPHGRVKKRWATVRSLSIDKEGCLCVLRAVFLLLLLRGLMLDH